jgi:tetratricopeptide (TPR) repeat protein
MSRHGPAARHPVRRRLEPACHEWAHAPAGVAVDPDAGNAFGPIDAHRNLRGPYTAAGTLLRAMCAEAQAHAPEVVAAHLLTLLAVAPELRSRVPVPADAKRWLAIPREGNWPRWTRRLAHGLADFLLASLPILRPDGVRLVFTNVDCADYTDQEFIAVLLSRADPGVLSLGVYTKDAEPAPILAVALEAHAKQARLCGPPQTPVPARWRAWLKANGAEDRHARELWLDLSDHLSSGASPPRTRTLEEYLAALVAGLSEAKRIRLARRHVSADGVSLRFLPSLVYDRLPASKRRALHRERATALAALGEPTLALGAIPYHRERAGDAASLVAASTACMNVACYDAALDWSVRGRRMLDPRRQRKAYGDVTRNQLFALLLLRRFDEVDRLCAEVAGSSDDPALLSHVAYAKAILNARLYDRSRHDYEAAGRLVDRSLSFTERSPASSTRAVNTAFLMNTRALVELRRGRPDAAGRLLGEAIAFMRRGAPGRYRIESLILWHNLSRLHALAGDLDRAVAALDTMLAYEPTYGEAWFDRGLIHQRAGKLEMALADYAAAIRWGPPQAEPHFNRGQILALLGRSDNALAEYDRALVLDPDRLEARLNRALLLYQRGDFAAAAGDVSHALRRAPSDARLLCLDGLLRMEEGDPDAAFILFSRAIEADPSLPDPRANRAIVSFRRGRWRAAYDDLTRALAIRDDPAVRYNRGRVLASRRRWREAAGDFERALALAAGDAPEIRRSLDACSAMIPGKVSQVEPPSRGASAPARTSSARRTPPAPA